MPRIKLDEPITWSHIMDMVRTVLIAVVAFFGWAYLAGETGKSVEIDRASVVELRGRVAALSDRAANADNRLSIVETNITHIRESLARIERALAPRSIP